MGPKRVLSLDMLRGIAAFSVAIPHFFAYNNIATAPLETVSIIAVEIFFVLSGYVLGPQILVCLRQPRLKNLMVFLVRRWMRTIPPYFVALAFTAILFGRLFGHGFWLYAFYLQNLAGMAHLDDYFSIAWSLSIEEWFYLTFPALLVAISFFVKDMGDRNLYRACAAYIALFTLLRLGHGADPHWGRDVRRAVIFRVDSIAYGFLLFMLHKDHVLAGIRHGALLRWGGLGLATLGLVGAASAHDSPLGETLFPFLAAAFGMLVITNFVALDGLVEHSTWLRKLSAFLGRISYSVYLFHLVLLLALKALPVALPLGTQFVLFLGLLIPFVTAFYYCVEQPILAARPHFSPPAERKLAAPDLSLA